MSNRGAQATGDALRAARGALAGEAAWVVGGAVRDRLLGRPPPSGTEDVDVAVAGDPAIVARRLAGRAGGFAFSLSEAFGAWRIVGPGREWQVDLAPLGADTIEDDLAQRDFTINAVAEPLAGGQPVDPFGGRADASAGVLRMVSPESFRADPLRTLRLARLACELGLNVDGETQTAAQQQAGGIESVASERVFAELKRIVIAPAVLRGLALMDELGLTERILPELAALRGVEQNDFHHLDVHDHTLATLAALIELERDPEPVLAEHAGAVAELLAQPFADGLTRWQALRFGALLHDAAKPATRAIAPSGRVTFFDHHAQGAQLARAALARLRASERLRAHVAGLTRHHLRIGFLVHERPLSRRALYRYLRACEPVEVDVTVLSIADRFATQGRNADVATTAHVELALEVLGDALRWHSQGPPEPLLRGDDLAAELGLKPGPRVGELLEQLEQEHFAGDVATREQALERARELLAGEGKQ